MAKKGKNKPFYKKMWFWALAIIIIIVAASSGEDKSAKEPEKDNAVKSEEVVSVETEDTDTTQDDEETEETEETEEVNIEETSDDHAEDTDTDAEITSGTYKVGEEIPAGEYLVISDSMAYVESSSDSTGALESIIFNLNLMSRGQHSYITVNDGEYLKLQGGHMYPVESAPSVKPADGIYEDGMYKVGQDIPAGEYKVLLVDTVMEMGYLEVSSNSSHDLGSIVTNENVMADTYITVSDGQYLTLQGLRIEK